MFSGQFEIFKNDRLLPALGELSVERVEGSLRRSVPGALLGAPPGGFNIVNVRYKPNQKLVLGLVTVNNTNPIGVRVFPREKLERRLEKARVRYPEHTFLLDDISAVAWVYPAERKLDLSILEQPNRLRGIIERQDNCRMNALELVHFVPEHTYTARVAIEKSGGASETQYLKIYYNDAGSQTACVMNQLASQTHNLGFEMPQVVDYDARHRLILLSALDRDPQSRLKVDAAAAILAEFHQLKISDETSADRVGETALNALIEAVGIAAPALGAALARVIDKLHFVRERIPYGPTVLLHGDPHLGNLFPLRNGRAGVIDLDGVQHGPAEKDLASFFAFELWCALRDGRCAHEILRGFPNFIDRYNDRTDSPVPMGAAWVELASKMLTERIFRGISRGKVSGVGEIAEFLRLAEHCLRYTEH